MYRPSRNVARQTLSRGLLSLLSCEPEHERRVSLDPIDTVTVPLTESNPVDRLERLRLFCRSVTAVRHAAPIDCRSHLSTRAIGLL